MVSLSGLRGRLIQKEPLRLHTSFKIGGPARFFIEPEDVDDLRSLLGLLKKQRIPFYVIGRGSNILVNDKGLKGVVIGMGSRFFRKIKITGNLLEAGAGAHLKDIVYSSRLRGLSGAEFLAGIPGTIGGALIMNAGIPARNIADLVEEVTIMDYSGKVKVLNLRQIRFGYRQTSLVECIILGARLRLKKDSVRRIDAKIREYLDSRKERQDYSYPSAGCIFRNPPGNSAGKLIDLCALKGKRCGGASISLKHGNFILNTGKAKARDVLGLMQFIKKEVKRKFNIILTPEIKIWGYKAK